jgi:hypothetical protein
MLSADRPSGRARDRITSCAAIRTRTGSPTLPQPRQEHACAARVELRQAVLVMAHHPRLQKRARVPGAQRRDVRIAQDLRRGAAAKDAPVFHHDDGRRKPRDLRRGMRHVEDRHLKVVPQPLEIRVVFLPSVPRRARPGVHQRAAAPAATGAPCRSRRAVSRRPTGPSDAGRATPQAQQVDDAVELLRRVGRRAGVARTGAHRSGSAAHRDAGTAGPPGRHSPCGACAAARRGRGRCRRTPCRRSRYAPIALSEAPPPP